MRLFLLSESTMKMRHIRYWFWLWFVQYPRAYAYTRVVRFHRIEISSRELAELYDRVNPNRRHEALEAELEKRGVNLRRPYVFQRVYEQAAYEVLQPHWRWKWCARWLPSRILVDAIPENFQ